MKFNSRNIILVVTLLLVGYILYYFREIVSYVIIAWVISMIGAPMVKLLRKKLGKNTSAALTLGMFILLFGFLLYLFVPPLVNQVKNLSKIDYEKVVQTLEQPLGDWRNWLEDKKLILPLEENQQVAEEQNNEDYIFQQKLQIDSLINPHDSSIANNVTLLIKIDANDLNKADIEDAISDEVHEDFFVKLQKSIGYYINPKRIQTLFTSTVSAFGNIIVGIASVFFIAFFFLREQGLFYDMISATVPAQYEQQTTHAIDETSKLLIRYFSGILLQMLIITIFVFTLLGILGIKNALLIGFFAAVMNVIPYIGPIIGAAFAVMITLSSNLGVDFYAVVVPQLIKVLIVFASMQAIDNFILQPNIFSKSVKAHPLEIFLIVLIGAKLGGTLGMVLAIPFYTALRVVAKVFLSEFKVVQRLTKNM